MQVKLRGSGRRTASAMGATTASTLLLILTILSECSRCVACFAAAIVTPEPPDDWKPLIDAGEMVWSPDLPFPQGWLTPGYYPIVGNGYLAKEPGPFVMPWENKWPWRDAGLVHVAGLNNGEGFGNSNDGPSHRAQLPSFVDPVLPHLRGNHSNATYEHLGSAIDYRRATYFNRTAVNIPNVCEDAVIEIRHYAHRSMKRILVVELEVTKRSNSSSSSPWIPCELSFEWNTNAIAGAATADVIFSSANSSNSRTAQKTNAWVGVNKYAEEPWLAPTQVAVVASKIPSDPVLLFEASGQVHRMIVSFATNITGDMDSSSSSSSSLEEAAAAWQLAHDTAPSLWNEHKAAWNTLWTSGGIEIQGNSSFAAIVNGSFYDILSSMREDWLWSTSPGGLGTNGYNGHTFWDMETWMFPVLAVLHPALAKNAAAYRIQRLNASMTRANENGYSGAFWVWESGITGLDTAPWRQADLNENHISADIPLAWRRYYYVTGDKVWLQNVSAALFETCRFWECRMTRVDSNASAPPPPGFGPKCSSKTGKGNFTVRNVICPDEGSGIVNDSAYTNAAAAETLLWCIEAASILNVSIPSTWAEMSASPYLPLVNPWLDPSAGPVHQEYTGYNGLRYINQADVALLQYPLGLKFSHAQAKRDLDYWSSVTNFNGMFTGDASYAAAYLALGERQAADEQLNALWAHLEPHFNVFMETADGSGTQHFITGSGGLLQNILFGYGGLRVESFGVLSFASQQPLLPPLGITGVKFRGLHLFGTEFDVFYNATAVCVSLQPPPEVHHHPDDHMVLSTTALELIARASGRKMLVTDEVQCLPNEPFDVRVVNSSSRIL